VHINNTVIRFFSGLSYILLFTYSIISNNELFFYIFLLTLITGSFYEIIQFKKMAFKNTLRFFLLIYIITSFLILIKIKKLEDGDLLLLILVFQIWASDVGGYIFGLFGKNYFSNISPKKTYEGLIGSFVFCFITAFLLQQLMPVKININFLKTSLFICTASILGDLMMSKFKRINNRNVSGCFLPGHGGFIDRLDSLFLATPIYYLYICV